MTQKELNIGFTAIHTIIHEKLHMKKVFCRWVLYNLTEPPKEECIRISKETRKLLNDGGHRIISKIVTDDETVIPFLNVTTHQQSKVWVFKDDPMPTMGKRQRAMKEVMYAVFFKSTGFVKVSSWKDRRLTANWVCGSPGDADHDPGDDRDYVFHCPFTSDHHLVNPSPNALYPWVNSIINNRAIHTQ
ncbi:uncharacterized protein TNCV_1523061 [Trichonephila clavipes]|nr:uncharacterized protein TNCV_1523061 [Trichonephila clavipes]